MAKVTALGLLVVLAILVTGSSASEQAPEDGRGWRSGYEGKNIPMDALGDFDGVAKRLGELLDQLEVEGKLDANAKSEITSWFENTEEEYMDRWFGDEGKFTIRFKQRNAPRYDREFREQTRSTTAKLKPAANVQGQDRVLTTEMTGQDHDIVWTGEMAAKEQEIAALAERRNTILVALVDLINEQAGTSAVPPGRHILTLAVNPGSINGVPIWFFSLKVAGQGHSWHRNDVFTEEMFAKLEELKMADAERDNLNAEFVEILDAAGVDHSNPFMADINAKYHDRHDCLEYGCNKWAEGQRFPPASMIESFEYPEV